MLVPSQWIELDTVESTQREAGRLLKTGVRNAIILAHHQSGGTGRFGRPWISERGDSLTMSIIMGDYVGHPRPWLLGMATACACAEVLECRIRWPNDLGLDGFKLGGILTELLSDSKGVAVPVVGIGINVAQTEFPEAVRSIATSVLISRGHAPLPEALATAILDRLAEMPEPNNWDDIEPVWQAHDSTHGKLYKLPSGAEALADHVGPGGELICTVDGEPKTVLAADALFGVRSA